MKRKVSLATAAALVVAGCSSTATITRPDGVPVRAQIVDSDANGLVIRNGTDGSMSRMERPDIYEVSHPGKAVILTGAGLLGVWGCIFIISPAFRYELLHGAGGDFTVMALPFTLILTIPAAIVIGAGSYRYVASSRAARAFADAKPSFELGSRSVVVPPPTPAPPPAVPVAPSSDTEPAAPPRPADAPAPPPAPAWPSDRSPIRGVEPPPS